jgi:thiol-disulfide isomerase/thioredoxin
MTLPFPALSSIICPVKLTLILAFAGLAAAPGALAADAKADYVKLAKELQVRELNTLMFAKFNDANLAKIAAFLKQHPKAPEREQVLYLRAYMTWSLRRYEKAPAAYAALLKEFPKGKFSRIARIREAAAYLFNGQAAKALPRLRALEKDYPDRPEIYARELAYTLSRCGQQKEALAFMDGVELQMEFAGKKRLLPRITSHFDKIRLIGKPLQEFSVKDFQTGKVINPAVLKGKVVLIDFWATWCGPCLAELPHLRAAHKDLAKQGFEVFAVSLDDDQQKTTKMIADRKMTWLHHFDGKKWKNALAVNFDVHSIPANLLVDRQGIVRAVNLRGKEITNQVKPLLKKP